MDHVAIMKKSWGLLPKILSGEKVIESRWYRNRSAPWRTIAAGDTVYFKNTGEPVTVRAEVLKIVRLEGLTPGAVKAALEKYGARDGIAAADLGSYYRRFNDTRYALLIFLKDPKRVRRPFFIDKTGFGAMAAWISVDDVAKIIKG